MTGRSFAGIAVGTLLGGLLIYPIFAATDAGSQPRVPVNKKVVDAAKEALQAAQAEYDVKGGSIDDIYRWSRRIVEAENFSPEAVKRHLALMRDWHQRALAMRQAGAVGGDEVTLRATEFYLAEAEADAGSP